MYDHLEVKKKKILHVPVQNEDDWTFPDAWYCPLPPLEATLFFINLQSGEGHHFGETKFR